MALKAATRKKMPAKDFGGPDRSFPMEDKVHARMAISGATRSERAGNISTGEENRIKSKARAKLGDDETAAKSAKPKTADGNRKSSEAIGGPRDKAATTTKPAANKGTSKGAPEAVASDGKTRNASRGFDMDKNMKQFEHNSFTHTSKDR